MEVTYFPARNFQSDKPAVRFRVTDEYLRENGWQLKDYICFNTAGASSLTGKVKDFVAKVR
jgi:hypothetical protein